MKSHSPSLSWSTRVQHFSIYTRNWGWGRGGGGGGEMDLVWRIFWSRLGSLGRELYVHFYRPTVLYRMPYALNLPAKIPRLTWKSHSFTTIDWSKDMGGYFLWIVYRGQGFPVIIWFGTSPTPSPPLPWACCLFFSVFLCFEYWRKKGEGLGEEPNHTTQESLALHKKIIQYSLPGSIRYEKLGELFCDQQNSTFHKNIGAHTI